MGFKEENNCNSLKTRHKEVGMNIMVQVKQFLSKGGGLSFEHDGRDCNNLTLYSGAITRLGDPPSFRGFAFDAAMRIKPDKVSVEVERQEDGQHKVTIELTIDWEDPMSGFSSVGDFSNWISQAYEIGFCLCWNFDEKRNLYMDIPRMQLTGGEPSYSLDKEPLITFKYEGLLDASTGYIALMLLRKTSGPVPTEKPHIIHRVIK
jgi:hypothetical protein